MFETTPAHPRRRRRPARVVRRRCRRVHARRPSTTTRRRRSPSPSPAATWRRTGRRPTCRSRGSTLPAGAVVLPVGHRATITVGLAHSPAGPIVVAARTARRTTPWSAAGSAGPTWRAASTCPSTTLVEAVRAARCELLLGGVADRRRRAGTPPARRRRARPARRPRHQRRRRGRPHASPRRRRHAPVVVTTSAPPPSTPPASCSPRRGSVGRSTISRASRRVDDEEWLPHEDVVRSDDVAVIPTRGAAHSSPARCCSRVASRRCGADTSLRRTAWSPARLRAVTRWPCAGTAPTSRCCGRSTASPISCRQPSVDAVVDDEPPRRGAVAATATVRT